METMTSCVGVCSRLDRLWSLSVASLGPSRMVEDYTFNLANQVDVEETEAKIGEYKRKNADQIAQRKAMEVG